MIALKWPPALKGTARTRDRDRTYLYTLGCFVAVLINAAYNVLEIFL